MTKCSCTSDCANYHITQIKYMCIRPDSKIRAHGGYQITEFDILSEYNPDRIRRGFQYYSKYRE